MRPGPRGKGPEVQELFRATSKQPAGMCAALALEAPPWTPLCANYVVVQVWRGTRHVPHSHKPTGSFEVRVAALTLKISRPTFRTVKMGKPRITGGSGELAPFS
jgi:hypothetical protein